MYMQNSGVKPNSLSDKKNNSHTKRGKLSDTLQEAAPLAYVRRKMNLRGFVKFKKIEKLGSGWVGQVTTRICFLGDFFVFVFFCCTCFNKRSDTGLGGCCLANPSFSRIFFNLFKLDKTPNFDLFIFNRRLQFYFFLFIY